MYDLPSDTKMSKIESISVTSMELPKPRRVTKIMRTLKFLFFSSLLLLDQCQTTRDYVNWE